jgi:hypothetical protein
MSFQHLPPFGSKQHAVALGTWAPHGRPFGAIEHTELDAGLIRHDPGVPSQGIDFPNDLPLGHSPHGGIAAHLGNGIHIHGGQQYAGSHVGCGYRSFTSGMAGTNYYDIVFWEHVLYIWIAGNRLFEG